MHLYNFQMIIKNSITTKKVKRKSKLGTNGYPTN